MSFTIKTFKKSAMPKRTGSPGGPFAHMATPAAAAKDALSLLDNEDDSCTVGGVDASGFPVDISAEYTITAVSDNPAVLSVDAPVGMTYTVHALTPGSANVLVTATPNPATPPATPAPALPPFTDPITVSGSAATGLVITHGPPVIRS